MSTDVGAGKLEKLRRDLVDIGDDASLNDLVSFDRRHREELVRSPDLAFRHGVHDNSWIELRAEPTLPKRYDTRERAFITMWANETKRVRT